MSGEIILTLNAGSSTVKFGFFAIVPDGLAALASGIVDFRDEPFEIRLTREGQVLRKPMTAQPDDPEALLRESFDWLGRQFDLSRLAAIGHRVVHGGDVFIGPAVLTDDVYAQLETLAKLAPLHQPQSLRLIRAMRAFHPQILQTVSFDTAFHATNAPLVRRFAIPRALYNEGIKRYGFHGLSYRYIAGELAELPPRAKVVVAHLGSGASLCAMEGGISRDTSMGFSTLDGVPMATRSGALDPGVILHLLGARGWSLDRVANMLYRESGLLGVSGFEADSRELLASDRPAAAEAIALFCHRIAGEVARLATTLRGLDALVFTAGIGENQPTIRARVVEHLDWLGLALDPAANAANARLIGAAGSRAAILVIPTNEEVVIAREAFELRKGQ